MRQLLRNAPVKILEIGARDDVRRLHLRGLQMRFELNVEGEIVFRTQIG